MVGVRLQPDQLARLDAWAAAQPDLPSRPEALRRLAALALAVPQKPTSAGLGAEATPKLAGKRVRHSA